MRFWKRVNAQGIISTVESYSHDLAIVGAIEITEQEFSDYLASLPPPPPDKRVAARERAIAAIKANQTGAPWGIILKDLAVAQGLIEE